METSDLTDERLAELEAMAKAATPGPRRALPNPDWSGGVWAITANPEHDWIQAINAGLAKAASKKNALFIAAADPDVVLSLIAEVRRLREELDESRRLTPYRRGYEDALRGPEVARMTDRLAESQANAAKLREALYALTDGLDCACMGLSECAVCDDLARARAALAETEARDAR